MASTKGKAGINNESSSGRDSGRTDAGSPTISAGAASLTTNRTYTLDDLDTIATVGKLVLLHQIKTRFNQQLFSKMFSYSLKCVHPCLPNQVTYYNDISRFSFWSWAYHLDQPTIQRDKPEFYSSILSCPGNSLGNDCSNGLSSTPASFTEQDLNIVQKYAFDILSLVTSIF